MFREDSPISMMRVMSLLALLAGIGLAIAGKDVGIVGIFVGAAFTGKVAQKLVEHP